MSENLQIREGVQAHEQSVSELEQAREKYHLTED